MNIAREFRVGNIVNRLGEPTRITAIEIGLKDIGYVSTTRSGAVTTNQIEPIPICGELLTKCGLTYSDGDFYTPMCNNESLRIHKVGENYYLTLNMFKSIHIKSLHQFQNVYFALIGEELKIEL